MASYEYPCPAHSLQIRGLLVTATKTVLLSPSPLDVFNDVGELEDDEDEEGDEEDEEGKVTCDSSSCDGDEEDDVVSEATPPATTVVVPIAGLGGLSVVRG